MALAMHSSALRNHCSILISGLRAASLRLFPAAEARLGSWDPLRTLGFCGTIGAEVASREYLKIDIGGQVKIACARLPSGACSATWRSAA